jgi:twinkle protein
MIPDNKPCPKCREIGRDDKGDNLFLLSDKRGYACRQNGIHHEPYYEWFDEEENMITFDEIENLPIRALKARGIDKDVAAHYMVRTIVNMTTGEDEGYCYPITITGKTEAYRIRQLPKTFMNVVKSGSLKGRKTELFGQSVCQKKGKKLLVCGGQDDMLAAFQMLWRSYPTYKPNVVSVVNGENVKSISDNLDFILSYEEVIICMDNDSVGKKAAKDMALLIGPKAKLMEISEKDANDMLHNGKEKEFVNAFFSAKAIRPDGIVAGGEIAIETLKQATTRGYSIPYPKLNSMLGGLRKGELVTISAGSGLGKSSFVKEIVYHLRVEHGLTVGILALEETLTTTLQSFVAIDNNIPVAELRMNPAMLTDKQWQESYDKIIKEKFYALDHFGSLQIEEFIGKMRHFAYGEKCDFILLDHLSLVISGLNADDERKMLDKVMTELAAFCTESGVGVISVVHLSRNKNKKSFNEGGNISLTDLRGSSGIEGLSWAVIGLERDQQDDEMKNISTIRVLKNRVFGFTGVAGHCIYHPEIGRLLPHVETVDF